MAWGNEGAGTVDAVELSLALADPYDEFVGGEGLVGLDDLADDVLQGVVLDERRGDVARRHGLDHLVGEVVAGQ